MTHLPPFDAGGAIARTAGTARTANLNTSWPFMRMLSKAPAVDATPLSSALLPLPAKAACAPRPLTLEHRFMSNNIARLWPLRPVPAASDSHVLAASTSLADMQVLTQTAWPV